MEQKKLSKKLKTRKNNIKDKEFGELIFDLPNNSFTVVYIPFFITLIGSIIVIFSSSFSNPNIWLGIGTIIIFFGLYLLGDFFYDRLGFYENGFIQSSILNANKVRISYHNLKKIEIEKKKIKWDNKIKTVTWYKFIDHNDKIIFKLANSRYKNLDSTIKTIKKELKK